MDSGASRSEAVRFLLERANEKRSSAQRARRLAQSIATQQVAEDFTRYAAELELAACEIEERACAVAETAEQNESLAPELALLVAEARRRIAETYPFRRYR